MTLITKVYRKPTHTGRYLSFNSNYALLVKRGLVQSLHKRASAVCQEHQDLASYAIFSWTVVPEVSLTGILTRRVAVFRTMYITYVNDVSVNFKLSKNRHDVRTIFRTKHTLRIPLMKPGQKEIRNRVNSESVVVSVMWQRLQLWNGQTVGRAAPWA
jgi:hypothetical protein